MIRCPPFRYYAPRSIEEAVNILAGEGPGAALLAGGTGILPNMKRQQQTPDVLVSLRRVASLRRMEKSQAGVALGAGLTLAQIAGGEDLSPWGALLIAASGVATPHIRNTGTLGGNLCLDTRCNYYDQTRSWRKAIDFCLKKDGRVCWVAPSSPRCWAASSTDCAPALIALGAEIVMASPAGQRTLPLEHLYRDDGKAPLDKRYDEIVTEIRLGDPRGVRSTYWKLRRREAFDFPVLSVAAVVRLDDRGTVEAARIVFGAVASRPTSTPAADLLIGRRLTDDVIERCADEAAAVAKPLDTSDFTIGWRKRMARAYVAGALRTLRGDDTRSLGLAARKQIALRVLP